MTDRDEVSYVMERLHYELPSERWDREVREASFDASFADGGHEHQKKLLLLEIRRLAYNQRPDFVADHIELKQRLDYANLMVVQAENNVKGYKEDSTHKTQWSANLRHNMDLLNYTRWRIQYISDRFKTYGDAPYFQNYLDAKTIALKYVTQCATESTPMQNYTTWKNLD